MWQICEKKNYWSKMVGAPPKGLHPFLLALMDGCAFVKVCMYFIANSFFLYVNNYYNRIPTHFFLQFRLIFSLNLWHLSSSIKCNATINPVRKISGDISLLNIILNFIISNRKTIIHSIYSTWVYYLFCLKTLQVFDTNLLLH